MAYYDSAFILIGLRPYMYDIVTYCNIIVTHLYMCTRDALGISVDANTSAIWKHWYQSKILLTIIYNASLCYVLSCILGMGDGGYNDGAEAYHNSEYYHSSIECH